MSNLVRVALLTLGAVVLLAGLTPSAAADEDIHLPDAISGQTVSAEASNTSTGTSPNRDRTPSRKHDDGNLDNRDSEAHDSDHTASASGSDGPSVGELVDRLAGLLGSGDRAGAMTTGTRLWSRLGCGRYDLGATCAVGTQPQTPADPAATTTSTRRVSPVQAYRQVRARLSFTAASPQVGPDHRVNRLRSSLDGRPLDSVVGFPLWFWAQGGDLRTRTVQQRLDGLSVRLVLHPVGLQVATGDGTVLSCAGGGTRWRAGTLAGAVSPTCGHAYQRVGTYRVEMTTRWRIDYRVDDGTGTVLQGSEQVSGTRSRQLRIGELQILINH